MYTTTVILIILASVLMCLIVLIQESKGGGLAADYASANQSLGVHKTTNFIEKATWTLAGIMVFLSVISVAFLPSATAEQSVMQSVEVPAPVAAPAATQETAPAAAPGEAQTNGQATAPESAAQ
ncbi:MAG: preprotein translocase subunit SecG [Bacteroidaceae bacterium]|nr:preprotein translocase subunit SecG [Bacteroidaceae bacterium]